MAYLTSYSFSQLCKETEIEMNANQMYDFFKKYINEDYNIYKLLNKKNILDLIQKVVLSSNDDDIKQFKLKKREYTKVSERQDDLRYIFRVGGKVKYHLYKDCESLTKGFVNFNVPSDFFTLQAPAGYCVEDVDRDKKYRKEAIEELRQWFQKNNFTLKRFEQGEFHLATVTMLYNAYFPKKYKGLKPLTENYGLLTKRGGIDASPMEFIQNEEDLRKKEESLLKQIALLVEERKMLCNMQILDRFLCKFDFLYNKSDEEIQENITRFDKQGEEIFWKHYTLENLRAFWKQHYSIKSQVLPLLNQIIQLKYSFTEKDFDADFLEQHNLECCFKCYTRGMQDDLTPDFLKQIIST